MQQPLLMITSESFISKGDKKEQFSILSYIEPKIFDEASPHFFFRLIYVFIIINKIVVET